MYQSILQIFPGEFRGLFKYIVEREAFVNEIRLRCDKPILIMEGNDEWYINKDGCYTKVISEAVLINRENLEKIVQHNCQYSIYAYEEEIRQGYITVAGGHRIGLVGQVVMENSEQIRTIKNIRAINIRVSHQIKGVSQKVLPHLYTNGILKSTLIVSPPGCGKTTLLRDLIRCISNGNDYACGQTVGVVDERSEIAGSYLGQPQNDVGIRTDILDACPKAIGMMLLVRAMSPKVIGIDELGSLQEIKAVQTISNCGIKMVATMHGNSMSDILCRDGMKALLTEKCFEVILLLGKEKGKCIIKDIIRLTEKGEWECIKSRDFY